MKGPTWAAFEHSGIVTDLPPEEVPVENWTAGQNVQFQDKATRRVGGFARFAGTLSGATGPQFALSVQFGAVNYWVYCTADKIFVTDGILHHDITPATALTSVAAGSWNGCILNGLPVLNNGVDAPVYWSGNIANVCAPIPGWPSGASARVIRAFKNYLFALNVYTGTRYESSYWWSMAAAAGTLPAEWTPAPDNDAGDGVLGDTPGGIVDGLALRDLFVIYKEESCYAVSYVGGQNVMAARKLFLTSGIQAASCVVEMNGEHWVFTGTDVIRHDGQNWSSLVQDKVKHVIVDTLNPDVQKLCCVVSKHRNQQIWICVATTGNAALNRAYVVNVVTGDVGMRELPGVASVVRGFVNAPVAGSTWDGATDSWDIAANVWDQANYSASDDSLLMVDESDKALWSVDNSETNDGVRVAAFVERQSLPTNQNISRALITRLVPRIEGSQGDLINVRVGSQAYFGQAIAWSEPYPFVIGSSVGVNVNVEGRLMSVRFESEAINKWIIHSYKVAVVDLGLF